MSLLAATKPQKKNTVMSVSKAEVFLASIKTSIEKGFHAGVALALGVVSSDMVFVGAILFGSQYFDITAKDKTLAGIIGSSVLFAIGIYYLFKKAKINYDNTVPTRLDRAGYFLKGFVMCIFNPTILFHWTIVIGAASTVYHEGVHNRSLKIGIMFLTILLVQFGMDTTKAFYANKLRDRISIKFVHRLNEIAGIALIIAALVLLDKMVTNFVFSPMGS
jgi:threonine/homoserine/homoserine lactone efflux protein